MGLQGCGERYKKFVETERVDDISLKEALELCRKVRPMRFSGLMRIWIRLEGLFTPCGQSCGCQFGFAGRRASVAFGNRRDV